MSDPDRRVPVNPRPLLMHEKLYASLRAGLEDALTADLTTIERGALTWMRAELRQSPRFHPICGEVTTSTEREAAIDRINAELVRRDAIKATAKAIKQAMAKPPRASKRATPVDPSASG